jgi:hypothetical protein
MNHHARRCICLAFSALLTSSANAEIPDHAGIRGFVTESHIHGIPYARANALGPASLPTLYAMLREDLEGPALWKIIITIGDIGSASSFDSLRAFMWDRYKGRIGENVFRAQASALYAIGSLHGSADQRSLDYLTKGADPTFWATLPWKYSDRDSAQVRTILASCAIAGLGLTGSARADSVLTKVIARPPSVRLAATARTAISRNAAIQKLGRKEFEHQIAMKESRQEGSK